MVTLRTDKGTMIANGDSHFEQAMKVMVCDPLAFKAVPSKEKTMRFVSIGNWTQGTSVGLTIFIWEGFTITFE